MYGIYANKTGVLIDGKCYQTIKYGIYTWIRHGLGLRQFQIAMEVMAHLEMVMIHGDFPGSRAPR